MFEKLSGFAKEVRPFTGQAHGLNFKSFEASAGGSGKMFKWDFTSSKLGRMESKPFATVRQALNWINTESTHITHGNLWELPTQKHLGEWTKVHGFEYD